VTDILCAGYDGSVQHEIYMDNFAFSSEANVYASKPWIACPGTTRFNAAGFPNAEKK
jgi:hypothetical protein